MNVWQSVHIAIRGLGANKLRAFLTMLGIIIGVAAVIALLSVGQGVQVSITEQVQSTGSNLITIVPGGMRQSNASVAASGGQGPAILTMQDVEAISDAQLPELEAVAAEFSARGQISYGSQTTFGTIAGVTPDYMLVRDLTMAEGDFIDKGNVDSVSTVVVLGANVAQSLFDDDDPLGKTIKLNRANYRVIGVLEAKGGTFGSIDNYVIIPISSAQKRLLGGARTAGGAQRVSTVYASAIDENSVDAAMADMSAILRDRHRVAEGEEDFTMISQKQILSVLGQITGIMTAFLGAIAAISLLVGGIGIMNIMLVSVTERTREIGIRKAVGAKRRDIMVQFLVEAIVLSVIGGLGGVALGWGLGQLINQIKIGDPPLTTVMTAQSVALAVGFSVAVGLFFGIYPATRAAALNPIDALRYE